MRTFNPTVECLEDRLTPIIHSFAAGAVASSSPNAAGSEEARAAILLQSALGATPPPVVAAGDLAEGGMWCCRTSSLEPKDGPRCGCVVDVSGEWWEWITTHPHLGLFGNSSNSLFTKNRGVGTILNDD